MVIDKHELPSSGTAWQFEGYLHNAVNVSFFISETPPGRGPSLHKHPYEEIFVVLDGRLACTIGDTVVEASAGQIVIVPRDTPHKFTNPASQVARHVDIHASARMVTTWLDEEPGPAMAGRAEGPRSK